jgi:uncharacterized membrane protein YeaQ/YmgE (transglycosylase-associated protein family)
MEDAAGTAMSGAMALVIIAIVGLLIGAGAKLLMPGQDPGGWFVTILLGIAGSWIGGFVLGLIGIGGLVPALIASVLGAMLLLAIYRLAKRAT